MEGNCTSGCRLAGSRERLRGGWDQREELGGGRRRNHLLGAAGRCPAVGGLHWDPGGAPSPIKVRSSTVSHPTTVSVCVLGAVSLKPGSGVTSAGPPWVQRLVQVVLEMVGMCPGLGVLCAPALGCCVP